MHILYRKPPVPFEVYNDIDGNLVNFFKMVKRQPDALCDELALSLYSRKAFDENKVDLVSGTPVERAARFYMVNRQSFGMNMRQWGITEAGCNGYFNFKERILEAHKRLQNVYIEHRDFRWVIERYDSPESLFYLDPPYVYNKHRGKGKMYENEMTDADHVELVEILKGIKGRFVLSGYANELYDCFTRVSLGEVAQSICGGRGVGKRPRKEEFIWMNY